MSSGLWLRVLGLVVASAWLAVGCGEPKKIQVGATCILNTDCTQPLVCTMSKCHEGCRATVDCPAGQICTKVENSGVCQLPAEAECAANVLCGPLLICAADLRCRSGCTTPADCMGGQVCVQNVCAESKELDVTGQLPQKAAPTTPGTTCTLNSDCKQPLVCAMGRCHAGCLATVDCPAGQICTKVENSGVCQLPAEAKCTANVSCRPPLDCSTANVPCGPPLICAADLRCRSGCSTPGDCMGGQVCIQYVCAENKELDVNGQLPQRAAPAIPDASTVADAGVSSLGNGEGCTTSTASACASGNCVDGVCCESGSCSGPCKSCRVSGHEGTCALAEAGTEVAGSCLSGKACDGSGNCKDSNGQACSSASTCASGFCVDGVCCNSACSGRCVSCNLVPLAGKCIPYQVGSDPEKECISSSGPCRSTCDGVGACAFPAYGSTCGSCLLCDGMGACNIPNPNCGLPGTGP